MASTCSVRLHAHASSVRYWTPHTLCFWSNCVIVSADDQVKAYIKKIMSQLNKWMAGGKISKLVIVITDKETGEHVERWQFDVEIFGKSSKSSSSRMGGDNENAAPG